jgi:hypothetical protein
VLIEWAAPVVVGVVFACGFWWPLPVSGGLIGGDIYNYFLPFKDYFASGLREGELRLWNPTVGNGICVPGESHTGVLYPPYLLAYAGLDVANAYTWIFLSHYVFAYAGMVFLAREAGASAVAGHLSAIIFTYGWFPPRACLEWSIVTGAWLPIIVGLSLRWLRTGHGRDAAGVSLATAMQLLAGHYNLAWITLLSAVSAGVFFARGRWGRVALLFAAIVLGFGLAGPQMVPSAMLRSVSQRVERSFAAEIEEGLIPPAYFGQMFAPWRFYDDADARLAAMGAKSNKVEAHLYIGLVSLVLAGSGLFHPRVLRGGWPWLVIALAGAFLASGIPMAALAQVPGFSFFRYCGRYGLATQLGLALWSAGALDAWTRSRPAVRWWGGWALAGVIWADLYVVGHQVQYTTVVDPPILTFRSESPTIARLTPTDRVLAVDGNTLALSGASAVPPYLGIGPAEYYRWWSRLPNVFDGSARHEPLVQETLLATGVTHLLVFEPLPSGWPATLLWHGYDPFLHRRWARDPAQPIYLYRYDGGPGRTYRRTPTGDVDTQATTKIVSLAAHEVVIETTSPTAGTCILTDLHYWGWHATVNGESATTDSAVGTMGRVVKVPAGTSQVVWRYSPVGFLVGLVLSAISLTGLIGMLVILHSRQEPDQSLLPKLADSATT